MMSSAPLVLSTVANKIAYVVMNRPGAMNAMSRAMITELRRALEHAQSNPDVSIIVLSGAGGNFCAGDDLKESEHQSAEDFLAPCAHGVCGSACGHGHHWRHLCAAPTAGWTGHGAGDHPVRRHHGSRRRPAYWAAPSPGRAGTS
ncbi:MAG: enoyl-CoA hydratase/isomerase family protein [Chloroflexi bacterium]|nr:MAG: enoyl-CoA hydratase/isomerase family protein [Chloroflexota bacterium]